MTVSKNNMWASHGLDRFCVRPYSKLGPEFQVTLDHKRHLPPNTNTLTLIKHDFSVIYENTPLLIIIFC